MNNKLLSIGLLCVVVGGGACLLYLYEHSTRMSDSSLADVPTIVIVGPAVAASTSTDATNTASTTSAAGAIPADSKPGLAPMKYEIVTTTAEQERGLGGRATIPDNYAMLFVFNTNGSYGFWMKDMLTSIDMIWLSDNGTILGIEHGATPASYPSVFYPPQPVRYVLETKVGLAAERGWKIGTRVTLPLPYGE